MCAFVLATFVLASVGALTVAQRAAAATCGGSTVTVTPMHSPDGTQRPFYADFKSGSTKHSGYVGYELSGASGVLGSDVWIKLSGFTGGSLGLGTNQSATIPARATSANGKPLAYAYLKASAATTTAQTFTVEVWNGKPGLTGSSQVCTTTDGFSKVIDVTNAAANKLTSITVSNASPAIGGTFSVTAVGDTGTMGAGDPADRYNANGVFSMAPAMDDSWPADAFTLTGVQLTLGGTTTRDKLRTYPSSQGAYTAVYSFTVRATTASATGVYPVQNIASGTQVKYTGTYPTSIPAISSPSVTTTLTKTAVSLTGPPYVASYQVDVRNSSSGATTLDYMKDTPTPTSGWTFVAGSAKLGGTTIADPGNDGTSLTFPGPFTVPANGSLTITYRLSLTATVSNAVTGQVGGVSIGGSGGGGGNQISVNPAAPIITTASLTDAQISRSYLATLAASGGSGTYTSWAVTSGSLPAGVSLNSSTGVLSGTPTATGTSSFTITVTDSANSTASKAMTLVVGSAPDTSAPTSGTLSINGGASTTTSTGVTLSLGATDDTGVTGYRVAEGSDCSGASWNAVASAASFSASVAFAVSSGDGAKTVCVQYEDAAGNVSPTTTASITLDSAPDVSLTTTAASPANAAFTVTATFTKAVTGFVAGDVTVGNGTVSNFQGSGATYTFLVTPSADGSVTVDVAANVAVDSSSVGNNAASQLSLTYDGTRPTVALATSVVSPTNGAFTVTATFSESVTRFSLLGITIGNGAASLLSGSGATYTFLVTPTADGNVTVDVGANAAYDSAGNGNTAATQLVRAYDGTHPSVTLSSTSASPLNSAFTVTATFSESVTGLALGSVSVGNGAASNLQGSGTTYTFTVTPSGAAVTVDLAANAATDAAGNGNSASNQLARTYDNTRPSVVLSSAAASSVRAAFSVTATFSESVTGLALGAVTVGNGTASNLQGSGTTYTFTVTPSAEGAVTVDLAASSASDAAGNGNTAASQLTRTYDITRPAAALSSVASARTNAAFTVTAAFSESVTGLTLGGITIGNGTASNLQGSGSTYTFLVTPSAEGTVTVDLGANAASDAAGNGNTAAAQLTRVYDATRPTVSLSTTASNPTNAAFSVTATFSESVTGLALGSISVGNGSASNLQGSGTTYTFTVTPAADGAVTVDLVANAANDAAGNGNTAAAQLTRAYDATRPSVALSTTAPDPTNAAFTVTATFSESVTGFALGDIAVGNGSASSLSGSGASYTFRVTPAAGGTVTVDVPANGASDAAGNGNTAATRLSRTYDGTRPTVALSTPATSPTNAGFAVTATFSKSVTGFALGDVTVGNGSASNLRGSGTTYTFDVTPSADGAVTVDVPAGGASDSAGNTNTAATQLSLTYDATRPSITLSSTAAATVNAAFTVRAVFSEPVTGFTLGDVTLAGGTASSLQGSGASYTFVVTPSAGVTVDVAANVANDTAGNGNTAAAQLARAFDATRPSATIATDAKSPSKAASFRVVVTFSKPVTGFNLNGVAVGNGTASKLEGSGASYTFDVAPKADGEVTVDVKADSAQDAVGNANSASNRLSVVSDRTAPVVRILSAPPAATTDTDGSVSYSVDDPLATVSCTLDGAPVACASGATFTGLAPGTHTFVVSAADAAGNTGSASATWTVGAVAAPSVAITSAPPTQTSSTSGSIAFTGTGGAATCSLDGAPFAACASPFRFASLAIGDHTFEVRVTSSTGAVATARTIWKVVAVPTAAPDIKVAATASTETVTSGQVFNTNVVATNVGTASATEFVLTIALPLDAEFVSGSATLIKPVKVFAADDATFPCSVDAQTVTCPVGVLDPSARYVVDLTLRALHSGVMAVNAQGTSAETIPSKATAWVNARPPKVQITVDLKTSQAYDQVRKGEIFDAVGTVANVGGATAEQVAVTFVLPSIGQFVSGTTVRLPGGAAGGFECSLHGRNLSCPIGELPANGKFVVKLRLRALASGLIRIDALGSSSTQPRVPAQLLLHSPSGKACSPTGVPRCPARTLKVVYAGDALFAFDSCRVSAEGYRSLRSLRPLIARARTVTVAGYTDAIGSPLYNTLLSLCRARASQRVLVDGMKDAPRVKIAGLGETHPVASNATDAGRARNRRVEVRVTVAR